MTIALIIAAWFVASCLVGLLVARLIPPSDHSNPHQGDADMRGEGGGGRIHEGTFK
ncbi:MAG: hypothetical protein JWR85_3570 [Marmoricola sp.]|nr:hypothetical protein [Marmoricola sp.]